MFSVDLVRNKVRETVTGGKAKSGTLTSAGADNLASQLLTKKWSTVAPKAKVLINGPR